MPTNFCLVTVGMLSSHRRHQRNSPLQDEQRLASAEIAAPQYPHAFIAPVASDA